MTTHTGLAGPMITRAAFLAGVTAAGGGAALATSVAQAPLAQAAPARPYDPMGPARLHRHVREVCDFGPRWTGYPAEHRASRWIAERMRAAGLTVEVDDYAFRRWDVRRWRVELLLPDGGVVPISTFPMWSTHAGSGVAELVDVGYGSDPELAMHDLAGKAAVVTGKALLNVFSTYRDVYFNLADAGARSMFVTSDAPDNLIRPTSWSKNQLDKNPIPGFNLGALDLARLREAARAGGRIRWRLDADHVPGRTYDVTAHLPGSGAESGALMVCAHVDSWFTGALDNATGVAGLIGLAEHFARVPKAQRPKDMYFVSVTGHDTGFPYGGLQHWVAANPRTLKRLDGFVNLDHLAAHHEEQASTGGVIDMLGLQIETPADQERALFTSAHPELATIWTPILARYRLAPVVPAPTAPTLTPNPDLEGIIAEHGVPTSSLTMATPHYHTVQDTPDRIPPEQLSRAVMAHRDVLAALQATSGSVLRRRS